MHIEKALLQGSNCLLQAGIGEAQVECEHMLMQILAVNRADIYLKARQELTPAQEKQFLFWVKEREKRIPLAYLLGDAFFYSLKLKVRTGCLIPRPETERLVEEAAALIHKHSIETPRIMDIGTGSGAIALALLTEFPKATATLVDFSAEALKIARENTADLGFLNRAELIQSDLFSASFFLEISRGSYDLILSNPPYFTQEDWHDLQPEVAYEPRMALDGGSDGLDFYKKIIPQARNFLKDRGWLGFEVGAGQAPMVCEEFKRNGYQDLQIFRDHQQIERIVFARK